MRTAILKPEQTVSAFPLIVTILEVLVIILSLIYLKNPGFTIFISIIVFVLIVNLYVEHSTEKESFNNPSIFSANDAGKIMRVVLISGNKIGIVPWGYRDYALQDLGSVKTYYDISKMPYQIRQVDSFFTIEMTENGTLIFKKVQVNGFDDKTKKPYEVIDQPYKID